MIDFVDNFLFHHEYESVINYCLNAPYYYGEQDSKRTRPTGMISNITEENFIFKLFDKKINKKVEQVKNLSIYRMYINCFAPDEKAFFHIDGNCGITCLFYVNSDYDVDDGGETQFILNNTGVNILPLPNRLSFFDATILHKATSIKNKHRFTIAVKYS